MRQRIKFRFAGPLIKGQVHSISKSIPAKPNPIFVISLISHFLLHFYLSLLRRPPRYFLFRQNGETREEQKFQRPWKISGINIPRETYSGDGFGMATHKSVYDDVFGGPPKFGVPTLAPRFEDYSEIFGGFHSSRGLSIPVLVLPVVDRGELSLDVRSSGFDYSQIFGGFHGLDFTLSFQDLVRKSNGGDDSSDDAWSPGQSESLADESGPSMCSERSQSFPNADPHHLLGNVRQVNASYHKVNRMSSETIWNGATLVPRSHDIPGHANRINENHTSQNIEDEEPSLQVSGDHNSYSKSVGSIVEERRFRRSISLPKNTGFGMHGNDLCHAEKYSRLSFPKNEPFVTVNDISLRTKPSRLPPPSRPPPVFSVKKGDPEKPFPNLRVSNSFASKWTADDSSLPAYDVEIDASSSKMASATVTVAIEKAQAKLRSAKESIGKKEVLHTHLKLQAQDSIKIMEEKMSHIANSPGIHKDDQMQGMYAKERIAMQSLAEERKKVLEITEEASDLIDGQKYIDLADKPTEKMYEKECTSLYQVPHKSEGNFAWREATEYFEVVETGVPLKAVEPSMDENKVVPSIGPDEHRHGTKAATKSSEQEEVIMQFKAVKERPKLEETKMAKENCECCCEWGVSEISMESSCQKEYQKKVEVDAEKMKIAKSAEIKKLQNGTCKSVGNLTKSQWNGAEVEAKQKSRLFSERRDSDRLLIDGKANERTRKNFGIEECDKRVEGAVERGEIEKHEIKQEERTKTQEESCEKEENEKNKEEVCQAIENEDILKETIEGEDHVKKFKGMTGYENSDNNLKRTFGQEGITRVQKLNFERGESIERLMNEDLFEMCVPWDCEGKLSDGCETGGANVRLTEIWERGRHKIGLGIVYEEEDIEESSRLTSASEEGLHVGEGARTHQVLSEQTNGVEQINWDVDDSMQSSDQGIRVTMEGENVSSFDGPHKPNDETLLPGKLDQNCRSLKPTQADILHGKVKKLETESKDGEQEVEIRVADIPVEERSHSFGKHEKHKLDTEDDIKSASLHYLVIDSNMAGIDTRNSHIKWDKNVSQMAYDAGNMKVNTHDHGQKGKIINGVWNTSSMEITNDKSTSHQVCTEWTENGKQIGAPLSAVLQNGRHTLHPDERCTSQNSERKERNLHEALAPKEKKTEERLQHTMELEMERLKKIEEEKEREKEREKDRMAVNRATLEAHDKSYSEDRERAERTAVGRATAEARQRAAAEIRERLEKVSMEAREKTLADKEFMEARLRAERAAVERATAEARQCAFEKAMAEKASFKAQERVERSVLDKFYFPSRNTEVTQNSSSSDLPSQSSGASKIFQYSYSSTHAGVDSESPQRCKARLERYRRTAERAAKALAEKNMRDLLAQKEQAERKRLAETLDAEVKRWSSGKEGNLRALLSTLQYILGPDSGWQPIPLTEVITSAAVKKAYRKATLCVHPDKLQQRGASIQQKYICEKVFDLLKEAWSTFNSEEW